MEIDRQKLSNNDLLLFQLFHLNQKFITEHYILGYKRVLFFFKRENCISK